MTDLFTEALKDAQKIREIAEKDAKNRLVEALTPYIKKVIAKEAAGDSDFYFEQAEEDDELDLDAPAPEAGQAAPAAPAQPQAAAPAQQPAATTAPAPAVPSDGTVPTADPAPIEDPAATGDMGVDATMPDEEGKIVVDFDDLFVDGDSDQVTITPQAGGGDEVAPVTPAGDEGALDLDAPSPAGDDLAAAPAPEAVPAEGEDDLDLELPTESVTFKEYQRVLADVSERVDRALYSNHVSDITRESLKQRLFDLLEAIDGMRGRGKISNKQARLNENKLEFLFLKLKEASLHNSYSVSSQNKGTNMKTLKEYAAQLFEEDENLAKDSDSSGETGMPVDDEYSEHAADVSGVDPHLGEPKDIEVHQDRHIQEDALEGSDDPKEEPWDESEPVIDEEDQDDHVTRSMNENSADADTDAHDDVAEGAAGFGDTREEPEAEFEVDDAELAEAVRAIRKDNIKKKLAELREEEEKSFETDAKEEYPDPGPEGGEDPSHDHLKEGMYEMGMDDMEDEEMVVVDDGPEDMGDGMSDDDADLVLSVDLPPEVEEELAELGLDDLDVDVDVNVDMEDFDDEDDEEEEGEMPDELGGDMDDEASSAEEDVVLQDDMDEMQMENKKLARKAALYEKRLRRAKKLLEAHKRELRSVKGQLVETNLFTSKAVYYSKFLQRALTEKALNKKALQQIVEHLDKGKSVAETKAIYKKIEQKLNEHKNKASRKLGGSSSKVTRPGSASLKESANSRTSNNPNTQTASRWQVLAGIKGNE